MKRLKPSFHRTFSLSRPGLVEIVRLVSENQAEKDSGRVLDFDLIAEKTTLGPVYIASMRRYALGTGLVDEQERLTELGNAVARRDSFLQSPATCWMLHYGLSCPHGAGPIFWNAVVTQFFRPGDELNPSQIGDFIFEQVKEAGVDKVSKKTASQAATALLGTYSKSDALGPIGMLEQLEPGRYLVKEPQLPSLWAFAYILAEYWSGNWDDVPGINISRVAEPGGPGSILMLGAGTVNRYLGDLQTAGFAIVQRRTPPFQLNRNWTEPSQFLEQLYG